MPGNELWQVRVFVGPDAMGNVTGVVTVGPDSRSDERPVPGYRSTASSTAKRSSWTRSYVSLPPDTLEAVRTQPLC